MGGKSLKVGVFCFSSLLQLRGLDYSLGKDLVLSFMSTDIVSFYYLS